MDNEGKIEELLNRVMKLEMTQSKHELEIETLKTNVSELIKNSNSANLSIQKILMILVRNTGLKYIQKKYCISKPELLLILDFHRNRKLLPNT